MTALLTGAVELLKDCSARRVFAGPEAVEPGWGGPSDVRRPAELLEEPDQPGGHVELSGLYPVASASWVRVMQVVPALAHRQDRQRPEVGGAVAARSRTDAARHVADRVDRPGDVVQQHDPHQAGPEERGERAPPGPGRQPTETPAQTAPTTVQSGNRDRRSRYRGRRADLGRTAQVRWVPLEQPTQWARQALGQAGDGRRSAMASAGRPPGRRTRDGADGQPPTARPGLPTPATGQGEVTRNHRTALNAPWVK